MAEKIAWLVLVYKIPPEPTRSRATVWRRIKALGAVYLQNGVATLPASPAAERALRTLRSEILGFDGEAYVFRCDPLAGQSEVAAAFNGARDEEYEEIIDRCVDFEAEIARELAEQHLTYAELEENDEDLTKLKGWLAKVRARDVLGAEGASKAADAVDRCEAALEDFAAKVYDAESST